MDEKRKPGRPPDHLKPIDPLSRGATLATLRFLRREKKMKAPAICNALNTFRGEYDQMVEAGKAAARSEVGDTPNFLPDETTINRAINTGAASDAVLLALNLWLTAKQPHLYKIHRHEEMVRSSETFVRSSRAVLGADDKLELAKINQLQGRYRLIRPFHLEPKRKAIAELFVVGTEESPYECRLTSSFVNEHGRLDEMEATGRIVPHAQRAMALLGNRNAGRSHLVLHFDNIPIDGATKLAAAMRGIVIAAVGPLPSSAYPVQCIRLEPDEVFKPHVLTAEEVSGLPLSARQTLNRGAVYWSEEDYVPWGRKR